jgi:hypothetical protein
VFATTNSAGIGNGGSGGAGIFGTSLTSDDLEIQNAVGDFGIKVTGLPAGQYGVYTVMQAGGQLTENYKFSVGPNIDTLTSAGAQQFSTQTIGNTSTWVKYTGGAWDTSSTGDNYVYATVTLTSADSLNAITENLSGNYSKLTVLEIVPLPEPASLAMMAVFFGIS